MILLNKILFICVFSTVNCEITAPSIPTPDKFLEWLFNTTIIDITNIAKSFQFHDVEPKDIKLLYYSRRSNTSVELNNENKNKLLDSTKPIKILIHGWKSSGTADFIKNMANNYHRKGSYNVIAVDWSEHSEKIYLHASKSIKNIGELVGKFVANLIQNNLTTHENIHFIGHSLGAHVSGFAGQTIAQMTRNKVNRITGLDAAAPLFEFPIKRDTEFRLSKGDAKYVDTIHTNKGFLGFKESFATADFYVNDGGPIQPGCVDINIFSAFVCSHSKSHSLFAKTINNDDYKAVSCSDPIRFRSLLCKNNRKVPMGDDTPSDATGPFYIDIDSDNKTSNSIIPKIFG